MKCTNCDTFIEEDPNTEADKRIPCPNCGVFSRVLMVPAVLTNGAKPSAFLPISASILLQAVVTPGEKTNEGKLITAVTLPWFQIIKMIQGNPSFIFEIPPRKWEEIIAGVYKEAGFDEVILTPRSGDFGRDVIAIKKGVGSIRVIDQVKAYKPGHLVDADDVRALMGVLQGDKASKGFLTTTSDFAPKLHEDPLISPFIPSRIELVNGEKLLIRLKELSDTNSLLT